MYEYEQSLIGGLLLDSTEFPRVSAMLSDDDFLADTYRGLWQGMKLAYSETGDCHPAVVADKCRMMGMPDVVKTIMELKDIAVTSAHVAYHAEQVRKESIRHQMKQVAAAILSDADLEDPLETMNAFRQKMDALTDHLSDNSVADTDAAIALVEQSRALIDSGKRLTFSSGLSSLDKMLNGGFRREHLTIIAARPGVGKSALALNLADNMARNGKVVLFVSMEMGKEEITNRRTARYSGVDLQTITSDEKWDSETAQKVMDGWKVMREFTGSMFYINDKGIQNVSYIEAVARSIKDLDCIFVDYLGLLQYPQKKMSSYDGVSANSRLLKALAATLHVPVVCLCQLNRCAAGETPTMAMLRDSGAIEQDANEILLLHERKTDQCSEQKGCWLDIIIDKNRGGKTGTITVGFDKDHCEIRGEQAG